MSCMRYDFPAIIERGYENYWQNFTYAFRSEPYPNNYGGPDHISWVNAKDPNQVPYDKQFVCCSYGKSSTGYSHDREVMCFRPDGTFDTLIVAPVMSDIPDQDAPSFYDNAPKAVLDPTGDYIFWTANLNQNRLYAIVAQVPWQFLVSEQDYNPTGPFAVPVYTRPPTSSIQTPSSGPSSAPKTQTSTASTTAFATVLMLLSPLLF